MDFNGQFGCGSSPNFSGDVKVDGRLFLSDGSDVAPSLTYTQESTTGWDRSGTGEVSFVTAGSKRVKLSTSGLFATNATFTNASCSTLVSTSATLTTATIPDLTVPTIAIVADINATSGTFTNASCSTLVCTTANLTNLSSATITNSGTSSFTGQVTVGDLKSTGNIVMNTATFGTLNGNDIYSTECLSAEFKTLAGGVGIDNGTMPMTTGAISCSTLTSSGSIYGLGLGTSGILTTDGAHALFSVTTPSTYTPFMGDSSGNPFTFSTQLGSYYVVGPLVFLNVYLVWTGKGSAISTDAVRITLPSSFPIGATCPVAVGPLYQSNITILKFVAKAIAGSTYMNLSSPDSIPPGTARTCLVSNCQTTGEVATTLVYWTN